VTGRLGWLTHHVDNRRQNLAVLDVGHARPPNVARSGSGDLRDGWRAGRLQPPLAHCNINGESLNEQLVRTGWAVARRSETTDYVAAEAEAKEKKLGLWQGEFMMPDAFRRAAGIFVERP
jgi:Staphylococcal nuclease homologue